MMSAAVWARVDNGEMAARRGGGYEVVEKCEGCHEGGCEEVSKGDGGGGKEG
jgi:hypothetical protein